MHSRFPTKTSLPTGVTLHQYRGKKKITNKNSLNWIGYFILFLLIFFCPRSKVKNIDMYLRSSILFCFFYRKNLEGSDALGPRQEKPSSCSRQKQWKIFVRDLGHTKSNFRLKNHLIYV